MKINDSQPSSFFVPATLVVVGRGSSSTMSSSDSGSETGADVTGGEEVTSITSSAGCGGSWIRVLCDSAGARFLANASAIVGCDEVAIWG